MPNPAHPKDAAELMRKYNKQASKALGQNFLVDRNILKKIVNAAAIDGELVLEIGPGLGAMTLEISERAERVLAVELDAGLIEPLRETLAGRNNVTLIHGDILKLDWQELAVQMGGSMHVVANLPYNVATAIISRMLEGRAPVISYTVMVQKEVAQRICARPGSKDFSMLSVAVQYFAQPRILFDVPPGAFMPRPNVVSSMLSILPWVSQPVCARDEAVFFKVVRAGFANRRKTLVNNLIMAFPGRLDKEGWEQALVNRGIPAHARAETLDLAYFVALSDFLLDMDTDKQDNNP